MDDDDKPGGLAVAYKSKSWHYNFPTKLKPSTTLDCAFDQTPIGQHVMLDLLQCRCSQKQLADADMGERFMKRLAQFFTPISLQTTQFAPSGYSSILLLAESHSSVHVWESQKFASFDLYCCCKEVPKGAIQLIMDTFQPSEVSRMYIPRGVKLDGEKYHPEYKYSYE